MRKLFFTMLAFMLFLSSSLTAQVTIGSDAAPDENALLDLKNLSDGSSNKGMLLPRVKLDSTTSATPLTAHVAGMVVYNTNTAGREATAVTPGYYYNDGTKWTKIEGANNVWKLRGNAGTDPETDFIGTIGNKDIVFKRDGEKSGVIGGNNTAYGFFSLYNDISKDFHTAIGAFALYNNKTGKNNTAVGNSALYNNDASNNTAVGRQAMYHNTTGHDNSSLGDGSLFNNTNGWNNTAIGPRAMLENKSGSMNVALGYEALKDNTTGSHSIAIGAGACGNLANGFHNIYIGSYTAGTYNGMSTSYRLNIGNVIHGSGIYTDTVKIGIGYYHTMPSEKLDVAGTIKASKIVQQSDSRLKERIEPLSSQNIFLLNPVSYYWNKLGRERGGSETLQYGFIAQEVEKIYPHLVRTDNKGYKSVDYIAIVPILTKALQDIKKENEAIKTSYNAMKEESEKTKKELNEIREIVGKLQNDIKGKK